MRVRWLGWAGVEIEVADGTVVIDPVADAGAVFAPLGDALDASVLPRVAPPTAGAALAGMVTHLHRDHADAGALRAALAAGAAVHEPEAAGGAEVENLALAQAEGELERSGLERRRARFWQRFRAGPFAITALPAVDGLGDPQVSWLVEAEGLRALHLGDTVFHGYWWRMARRHGPFDVVLAPINGPLVSFPHLQPPSPFAAALEPEQAVAAARLLGARTLVPIHYDGYGLAPLYSPAADPLDRLAAAAKDGPVVRVLEAGEAFDLVATTA